MNGVVAFGSRGGCAAGTEPNDSPASEQPELCSACGIGEHQPETGAGQGSCTLCREGAWSNAPKSTFCFVCKEEHWCEGGDTCKEGRDGGAVCADHYWSSKESAMNAQSHRCSPDLHHSPGSASSLVIAAITYAGAAQLPVRTSYTMSDSTTHQSTCACASAWFSHCECYARSSNRVNRVVTASVAFAQATCE